MEKQGSVEVSSFPKIEQLAADSTVDVLINVTYKDFTTPAKFKLITQTGTFSVEITPPLGELIVGSVCPPEVFELLQKKYAGFNQSTFTFTCSVDQLPQVKEKIQKQVNINCLSTDFDAGTISFFGTTVVNDNPVLFFIKIDSSDKATCQINCADSILSSLLTPLVKKSTWFIKYSQLI